jgi:hypothetical protein
VTGFARDESDKRYVNSIVSRRTVVLLIRFYLVVTEGANCSWKTRSVVLLKSSPAGNVRAYARLNSFFFFDYGILQAGRSSQKDGRVVPKHIGMIKDCIICILCARLVGFVTRKLVR